MAWERNASGLTSFSNVFPSKRTPWATEHETIFIGSESILALLSSNNALKVQLSLESSRKQEKGRKFSLGTVWIGKLGLASKGSWSTGGGGRRELQEHWLQMRGRVNCELWVNRPRSLLRSSGGE